MPRPQVIIFHCVQWIRGHLAWTDLASDLYIPLIWFSPGVRNLDLLGH